MIRKVVYVGVLVFILLGCQSRFKQLMMDGVVERVNYKETIPFDFSMGLPFIKVRIQGEDYRFLFDTGAPNTISQELAEIIRYKKISSINMGDSQGGKREQVSILLDSIQIGEVTFSKMGAFIIDHNKVFDLACLEFDGIIGSNLMCKAIWEIDYEKKLLSFSDSRSSFEIPDDAYKLPFRILSAQRKPVVRIKTDKITFNKVTFDTGSAGALGLVSGKAKVVVDSMSLFSLKGSNSVGIYGDGGQSIIHYAFVDSVSVGDLTLLDQLIEYESKGAVTLGNKFLKGYRVIMDWDEEEMTLIETNGYSNREYKSYGFIPKFENNKMYVRAILEGSMADSLGLQLNTQILQINDYDFRSTADSTACSVTFGKPFENLDEIELSFLKDSTEVKISLENEDFAKIKKDE